MANYLGSGGFDPQSYMMRKLMDELFKDKTPEHRLEASTMGTLASSASSEGEFQKLDKVLDEYWERNNAHGADINAMEAKQRADYGNRKKEFNQFKQAHIDSLTMLNTDYLVSATDEKGGIQNITTNDVSSWNHEKLTEELGKVNRINDALGYAEKGYKYHMEDSPHTTLSVARDIKNYRDNLMSALGIAVETNEIPKDDVLLRMIVSGDTEGVKKHSNEQRMDAVERYKVHDSNIDTHEALLSKVLSYENKPDDWSAFLGGALMGKEGEETQKTIQGLTDLFSSEGFNLDYSTYAQNIGTDLQSEYALRKQANERHKKYTGRLYEDVGTEISENMQKFQAEGYTLEVIDEDDKPSIKDGSLADIQEGKKEPKKETKDEKLLEDDITIKQTNLDEKRFSNKPGTFPSLKKAKGRFIFSHEGSSKEWNNLEYVKGVDQRLPVLDAGYDKYYWYNGKWKHAKTFPTGKISAGFGPLGTQIPAGSKKEVAQTKRSRQTMVKEASKNIEKMARKLGYSDIGDATKKTKGKPVDENVYKYSKSLWEQLPKKTKAQFGSFNVFMEAVISASKTDIEFNIGQ